MFRNNSFIDVSDDIIFFDERKQRYIYMKEANDLHQNEFRRAHFTSQRPDYTPHEQAEFKADFRIAQRFLRHIQYAQKLELRRLQRIMPSMHFFYNFPLIDDYMQLNSIQSPRSYRLWTWDDSSKMVNFLRNHREKAAKYGLDLTYPLPKFTTKEDLQRREDALTEFFVHQMRKAPVA